MAKKSLKQGIFITFEGVEGCGKTTHAKIFYKYLKRLGYPCVYTREPGGTNVGNKIRKILLNPRNTSLCDLTEFFLFEASRAQIVDEVIRPALRRKKIVICDRFSDATMAYQGYGDGLCKDTIKIMSNLACEGIRPDLTIIMDIETKKGLYRATRLSRVDRMEKKNLAYHKRVRKGYLSIARKNPGRIKVIKTKKLLDNTQKAVRREVMDVIQRYLAAR